MDSLYVIVIFCIFTECHGKAEGAYEGSVNCNRHNTSEGMFSCFYEKYHKEKRCMKIIKKFMQRALHSSPTNECLEGRSKYRCKKCYNNENSIKKTCKEFLSFCIESLRKQRSEFSGKNGEEVTTNSRNNTLNRNTDNKKGKTYS
ncbi:uncharacterized protein LOC143046490 [Mytilus galloprovincialis]|uniref:uncharacterized protein LOC143046490 n=1 Tax=Mytilus galloprovincialis TaxID=29158 RepID=UPI003F7C30E5